MSQPRLFDTNLFYHVFNRGNRKQKIFEQLRDYQHFLEKFSEFRELYPVDVVAYCLMPNHFHFLLRPSTPTAISQLMSRLCNSHSRYYNVKYDTIGGLFQGRFKSKEVTNDEYFVHLSRYIHLNPAEFLSETSQVEPEIARYRWSSYSEYVSRNYHLVNASGELLELGYFKQGGLESYREFVKDGIKQPQGVLPNDLLFED